MKDWPDTAAREALARCCEHAGMSGLARCCAYMQPGEIEARLNWVLSRTDFRADMGAWFRLEAAKDVARRIRKPINDYDDYVKHAESCLTL